MTVLCPPKIWCSLVFVIFEKFGPGKCVELPEMTHKLTTAKKKCTVTKHNRAIVKKRDYHKWGRGKAKARGA